jgi:hypothetical protein
MNRFNLNSARMSLMIFAVIAAARMGAHSSSLDERFKASVNTAIHNVKETEDPVAKRKMLGEFLTRMDQGIGMAKVAASMTNGQALADLQLKMRADLVVLNGVGTAKVPDADLNRFADFVQQDVEQASSGIYISVGGLLLILILLLLIVH